MQEEKIIEEYLDFEDEGGSKLSKISLFWNNLIESRYFYLILLILLMSLSFLLGRISLLSDRAQNVRIIGSGEDIKTETKNIKVQSAEVLGASTQADTGQVVASKSGTKYHYPWCAGAKQISEKNKIIFKSISDARAKGYTPATNCKGLE